MDAEEIRLRGNARAYANVYQKRGHLVPKPCEVCGEVEVEKHHPDYSQPLVVHWLCKKHHEELHSGSLPPLPPPSPPPVIPKRQGRGRPRKERQERGDPRHCVQCGEPNLRWPQTYCHECHKVYMREYMRRYRKGLRAADAPEPAAPVDLRKPPSWSGRTLDDILKD